MAAGTPSENGSFPLLLAFDDSHFIRPMMGMTLRSASSKIVERVDGVPTLRQTEDQDVQLVVIDRSLNDWMMNPFDSNTLLAVVRPVMPCLTR